MESEFEIQLFYTFARCVYSVHIFGMFWHFDNKLDFHITFFFFSLSLSFSLFLSPSRTHAHTFCFYLSIVGTLFSIAPLWFQLLNQRGTHKNQWWWFDDDPRQHTTFFIRLVSLVNHFLFDSIEPTKQKSIHFEFDPQWNPIQNRMNFSLFIQNFIWFTPVYYYYYYYYFLIFRTFCVLLSVCWSVLVFHGNLLLLLLQLCVIRNDWLSCAYSDFFFFAVDDDFFFLLSIR